MPYFAHLKSIKQLKKFRYQAFNEHSADKLIAGYIFEKNEMKNFG